MIILLVFSAVRSRGGQADSLRQQALEQMKQGDRLIEEEEYRLAKDAFEKALAYFDTTADCYHRAYCYLWLGEAIYGTGTDYEAALATALRSREIADDCPRRKEMPFYSMILQNLAVFYSAVGNFDRQRALYREAFDEILRFYGRNSERGADAYYNLGVAYGIREQWDKAIAYFDSSLQIAEGISYQEGIASACHNLSFAYGEREDYMKAIDYQRKALRLTRKKDDIARGKNNLGVLYSDLRADSLALANLEEALVLWGEIYPPYNKSVLSTLLNIARVHFDAGDFKKSMELVDRIIEQVPGGGNSNLDYLKMAYHYKAIIFQQTGDLEEAENYARKAGLINGSRQGIEVSSSLVLANVLGARRQYEEALEVVQKGLVQIVAGFRPSTVYDDPPLYRISDMSLTLDLLALKARLFYLQGAARNSENDLSQSLNSYMLADSLVSFSRRTYQDNSSKELLAANARQLYAGAVEAGYKLYELCGDEAYADLVFSYSEKNKALLVLEKMHDLYAKDFYGIPKASIEAERRLLQDIEFFSNQIRLYRAQFPEETKKISAWEEILFSKRLEQDSLLLQLRREFPEYYRLKHDLTSATTEVIQEDLLRDDEALVEYFITPASLYIFTLTRENRFFSKVPLPREMNGLVEAFRNSLILQEDAFYDHSYALYELVLKPVERHIRGKKLIVIPDGALGYLPFEALLTRPVAPEDYGEHRRLPYLIRSHELRHLFSASLALKYSERPPSKNSGKVLAIAPSFPGLPASAIEGREEFRTLHPLLSPLPGSEAEIALLRERFNGDFWQGEEAREARFKTEGEAYRLIHISTHTLINEHFPSLSKLVFSQEDPAGPEDGYLNSYELFNLRLRAELIVLSSCNTGIGAIREGEGIASLARAFAYAGSPNLVMSLWPVKDKTTPAIIGNFYDLLDAGVNKGEALRQAKLTYLDSESELLLHPFFWATFIYAGDQKSIALEKKEKPEWMKIVSFPTGITLLLLALALIVRYWKRRRHSIP